jgi:phosphohistidine swiveling domain-containing protein
MAGFYRWPTWDFDEEVDLEVTKCWVLLALHSVPMRKPFTRWYHVHMVERGTQVAAETFCVPTMKGWAFSTLDGHYYVGPSSTTDEEKRQREPIFRQRIKPWIDDFEAEWRGKLARELEGYLEEFKKIQLEKLSNLELLRLFERWIRVVVERAWEIHFLGMMSSCCIYGLFEQMSRELLDMDANHPTFKKLMTGFEHKTGEVAAGLWRLGDRAKELGLEPVFQGTPDDEELLAKLEKSEAGRKWLQELHKFLDVYGWQNKTIHDPCVPTWIEQPAIALPFIRADMAKGGAYFIEKERQRLVKERKEAEKEVLSRVPVDKRGWFEKLMKAAPWAGRFNEEHIYYVDGCGFAAVRHLLNEVGKRFAQAGVVDDPDDVNFLVPYEIERSLIFMQRVPHRKTVRIRRQQYEEWGKPEAIQKTLGERFFLGDPRWLGERIAEDPMLAIITGMPVVKPELKADLYAAASAPGVVEGVARVIMSEAQMSEVQAGEILVTVATTPGWNPIFGIIKGVVTDQGGQLAHAVIVGREYGIPCVAGTQQATAKIKTGMRIRVDGDMGAVYILDK